MSSPIAHGLVAVSLFTLVTSTAIPTSRIRLPRPLQVIGLTAVACLPDIDFILSPLTSSVIQHREFTHSIIFVIVFWLTALLFLNNKTVYERKWSRLLTLLVASHILVDLTVQDGIHATTLQLFWPFSPEISLNRYFPIFMPINWVTWSLDWQSIPFAELLWIGIWEATVGTLILVLVISYLRVKFYLQRKTSSTNSKS